VLGGCATTAPAPAPPPVSEEARAALARIEQHRLSLHDLRSRADITIRRSGRAQRLTGVLLLLGEPPTMRFEALSPLGTPVLIVAGDPKSVTLWEVLDDRAYIAPASPDANRRWLGLALGVEDLVALLGGRVRAMPDPTTVELVAADAVGPSLRLSGAPGERPGPTGGVDRQEPGARDVHAGPGRRPAGRLHAGDRGRIAAGRDRVP